MSVKSWDGFDRRFWRTQDAPVDFVSSLGGTGARAVFTTLTLVLSCACAGSSRRPFERVSEGEPQVSRGKEPDSESSEEKSAPAVVRSGVAPGPRSFGYLEVSGFLPAPYAAPEVGKEGLDAPLRVFVIAHGAGGRGEHHCAFWEEALPPDVALVCPQGSLLNRGEPEGGAYFSDHLALGRELGALRVAIMEKWGANVQDQGWRYIGYSQGATMGALAVVGALPVFTELVLIEGGGESWTAPRVRDFKLSGGQRVLLACGTPGCAKRGEQSASALRQAGLDARHVHAPGGGHTYGGEVGRLALEGMRLWESEPSGAR